MIHKIISNKNSMIVRGNIFHTLSPTESEYIHDGWMLISTGKVMGVANTESEIPAVYKDLPKVDFKDNYIIPAPIDTHVHAPQFVMTGKGMDMELLDWLYNITFPTESKFSDIKIADKVYRAFVKELWRQGTMRSIVFGTIHIKSNLLLAQRLADAGLQGFIGKVNMDREAVPALEESTEDSIRDTYRFINQMSAYQTSGIRPIITPRFAIGCTDDLLSELGNIASSLNIPIQSHINESPEEIEFTKKLFPRERNYADVYARYGLFGDSQATIMAHGIYNTAVERYLMRENGVFISHCPLSNFNLSSGLFPYRKHGGIAVSLGSDVGAGHTLGMFQNMVGAMQVSKMINLQNRSTKPLSFAEAFYMATKAGGLFFEKTGAGKVGNFTVDSSADFLVVDPGKSSTPSIIDEPKKRLQQLLYDASFPLFIKARYLEGNLVSEPDTI